MTQIFGRLVWTHGKTRSEGSWRRRSLVQVDSATRGGILPVVNAMEGRIAVRASTRLLARLCAGRRVVLICGQNGKTTTATLVGEILGRSRSVVTNIAAPYSLPGMAAALMRSPHASTAVLCTEPDSLFRAIIATRPAVVILTGMDHSSRVPSGPVRAALSASPAAVIADADDAAAARLVPDDCATEWISRDGHDVPSCSDCGRIMHRGVEQWSCVCGLTRPVPRWKVVADVLSCPEIGPVRLRLSLPGPANRMNAGMAVAATSLLGVPVTQSVLAARAVTDVAGRYRIYSQAGQFIRFLLAENETAWRECLHIVLDSRAWLLLTVNQDDEERTWFHRVRFDQLRGRGVTVAGRAARLLSGYLSDAGVKHHIVPSAIEALNTAPSGRLDVITDYSAFRSTRHLFE